MSKVNDTQDQPTVNEQITKLDACIAWFDSDEFTLEESFDRYKEAEKLAADIETQLKAMKNEITVLKQRFDEK